MLKNSKKNWITLTPPTSYPISFFGNLSLTWTEVIMINNF